MAGLQKIVASAKEQGIDLKVVVLDKSPAIDTPLRDIATEIGSADPGSTVLVLSPPGWAGTYSGTYDRVILEAGGQDVAKTAPQSRGRHTGICGPVANTRLSLDGINDHARDRGGGCSGCFNPSSAASGTPLAKIPLPLLIRKK